MSARHYHFEDYPETLAVLAAVAAGRDLTGIGYEPGEFGAEIDWEALTSSWLSSTEEAAVHIARGVALAERAGGLPPHIAPAVLIAADDITRLAVSDPRDDGLQLPEAAS
jgi:hypothetical protein